MWAAVALQSFGGPAGQIAVMHRALVDERRWVSEERFLHALSFCLLLPGPEAQQLSVYLGWLLHGVRGGVVAGVLFVLPGFAAILVLSLFSTSAVVTFGGAYAVLAFLAQQAVERHGWLTAAEMTTGLGLAESTPGPLIMVVQFVGFLAAHRDPGGLDPGVAAVLASVLTVWVTFLPSFAFVFFGAPAVERLRGNAALAAALAGVGAAVVGVIASLALYLTAHTLFDVVDDDALLGLAVPRWSTPDLPAVTLAVLAAVLLFRLRWPVPRVLAVSAAAGLLLGLLGADG